MTKANKALGDLLVNYHLSRAELATHPDRPAPPMARALISGIETHLGGSRVLEQLGASAMFADSGHVSFALTRPNPRRVRTVVIAAEPNGDFHMDCYGERPRGSLSAPCVASAGQIVPENLATVLGKLTGIEAIHHRHF